MIVCFAWSNWDYWCFWPNALWENYPLCTTASLCFIYLLKYFFFFFYFLFSLLLILYKRELWIFFTLTFFSQTFSLSLSLSLFKHFFPLLSVLVTFPKIWLKTKPLQSKTFLTYPPLKVRLLTHPLLKTKTSARQSLSIFILGQIFKQPWPSNPLM